MKEDGNFKSSDEKEDLIEQQYYTTIKQSKWSCDFYQETTAVILLASIVIGGY
jgi:hypothetical protein